MEETAVKPLTAILEGDAAVELGEEAMTALRRETIRKLADAQTRVEQAFYDLPELTGPEVRGNLEQLGIALADAGKLVSVLWWLAPSDEATS